VAAFVGMAVLVSVVSSVFHGAITPSAYSPPPAAAADQQTPTPWSLPSPSPTLSMAVTATPRSTITPKPKRRLATRRPVAATTHHQRPTQAPAVAPGGGPTAMCNDGTVSYSQHHQGTCSHHGGVAVWYK
jgi:hypothetical protein